MKKANIWIIGIGALVLTALLLAFALIYTKKDKDFNIDGQYQVVQTDSGFGVDSFNISGNRLVFNNHDFYINKIGDDLFAIKSLKDTIYLKYNSTNGTLELCRNESRALYINTNKFEKDFKFKQNVYMDFDNGSAIILQDNHTLVRQNVNSGEISMMAYTCTDSIMQLTDNNTERSEYYYFENDYNLVLYDMQGNKSYDYFPADKEYHLSGYEDVMNNKAYFNLDIDECQMAEFGEHRFLVSNGEMYQSELLSDAIAVKHNGEDFYYYQIGRQEIEFICGNYTTNDALGMLILREDGSGNLTLDMKGLNFEYVVYDKYLKCIDDNGTVFLIPYTISDTRMEITIIIEKNGQDPMINFYRLRDIP